MDEEEAQEQPEMRQFDKKCKDFQSNDTGKVIKSSRKFGVEIEMLNSDVGNIQKLAYTIHKSFGVEHDGSIIEEKGLRGIEVVTPVISGVLGENLIVDLFQRIRSLGFVVNKSCGLHVHLDGTGFKRDRTITLRPLHEIVPVMFKKIQNDDDVIIVSDTIILTLCGLTGKTKEQIASIISDESISENRGVISLSHVLGEHVKDIVQRNAHIVIGKHDASVNYFTFADEISLSKEGETTFSIEDLSPKPSDWFCIIGRDNSLRNVKTLLYLYSVYNDVFMAMLPQSRRANVYCQSIASSFAPTAIEAIQSYDELENEWYKTKDLVDTAMRKRNNYDDSRYYGINLHSLFAKYGTVEIRSHSATLEPNKVLFWTALHQHIMDSITEGRLSINELREGMLIYKLEDKVDYLIRVLGLRTSLRKYMLQRIQYFNDNPK